MITMASLIRKSALLAGAILPVMGHATPLNVTAVNTLTKKGTAYMRFTMEVGGVSQLQRAITLIREVPDVIDAQRK